MDAVIALIIIGAVAIGGVAVARLARRRTPPVDASTAEQERRRHELMRTESLRANDASRGFGGITGGDGGAY